VEGNRRGYRVEEEGSYLRLLPALVAPLIWRPQRERQITEHPLLASLDQQWNDELKLLEVRAATLL
jgi:hypothetical protein